MGSHFEGSPNLGPSFLNAQVEAGSERALSIAGLGDDSGVCEERSLSFAESYERCPFELSPKQGWCLEV